MEEEQNQIRAICNPSFQPKFISVRSKPLENLSFKRGSLTWTRMTIGSGFGLSSWTTYSCMGLIGV